MKKLLYIIVILFFSCNSEKTPDCFQKSGTIIEKEIAVDVFDEIYISEGIELIIKEGNQKVVVKTGENLMPDVSIKKEGSVLKIENFNDCDWSREYNNTKVYVTSPNIKKIYSASQYGVYSDGILHYPTLNLQSGIFGKTASGTFDITVDNNQVVIEDNQTTHFIIKGKTTNLNVNFYNGDERFDGENLETENVFIFQRSSNDIIVKPTQSLTGTIYSTGDVICLTQPTTVQVEQRYTGRLIYR
jgi:hypothetical protein